MEKKYYGVRKKSLAIALNFIGFEYYINTNDDGSKVYTFIKSTKFEKALDKLMALKNELQ